MGLINRLINAIKSLFRSFGKEVRRSKACDAERVRRSSGVPADAEPVRRPSAVPADAEPAILQAIRPRGELRGTGIWPATLPRPWNLEHPPPRDGAVAVGVLIDRVAVASAAAEGLREFGWPGISLMDQEFQLSIIDKPEIEFVAAVEQWFVANEKLVCDTFIERLSKYEIADLSATAKEAMTQAVAAYREGRYLSVVRVLLPEFEALARGLLADDSATSVSQRRAIDGLKALLDQLPIKGTEPLESFSLRKFIDEHFFAQCYTKAEAESFGGIPNRHAELHGFSSFGTRQGAITLLCVTDFLFHLLDKFKRLSSAATESS
jgi:hypothetical protein